MPTIRIFRVRIENLIVRNDEWLMNNLTISLFIYLIFIPTFIRLFGDRGIEKSREKENLCLSRSFNFVA